MVSTKFIEKLKKDEIIIWRIHLDYDRFDLINLSKTLSPDEKLRSDKFYFEKDRSRYVISHGILRELLSFYTGITPKEINFYVNDFGKPYLLPDRSTDDIRFNISHSNQGTILAFSKEREIGVDLEFMKLDFPSVEIVDRFFSKKEKTEFLTLRKHERVEGFYKCWTRKEAYIKAIGKGLSIPLDSFDVSLKPGEPVELVDSRISEGGEEWSITDIDVWEGYTAAICIQKPGWRLKIHDW